MNLERLPEKLLSATVILVGMVLAVVAGSMSASGRGKTVLLALVACLAVVAAIQLGANSWLLIPVFWGFGGTIPILPLPFALRDLVILYVFGIFLVLTALRIVRAKRTVGLIDVLLMVNLLWLVFAFVRNPVGVLALSGDRVGGKPYFNVAIACMAYWVLSGVKLGPRGAWFLPAWMMLGPLFDTVAGAVGRFLPEVGDKISKAYSGFAPPIAGGEFGEFGESRETFLSSGGSALVGTACAYWRPFSCLLPIFPMRFLMLVGGALLILFSGFRSAFLGAGVTFLLAGWFRSRLEHLIKCVLFGLPLLVLLCAGQGTVFDLPSAAQRTMSFLPGRWDYQTVSDAKGSTEWRLEMWKDALFTDAYIKDKWLGDGFGVDLKQWQAVQTAVSRGIDLRLRAEAQAIMGGFHSGPISTIRVVGYIGLVPFFVMLCLMATLAWRLVVRAKKTPYLPLAVTLGIPAIITPVFFIFVFGAYDSNMPGAIVGLGMLHMLRNSLEDYEKQRALSGQAVETKATPAHASHAALNKVALHR